MSDQEDTLRTPKYYHESERRQIEQHGSDEPASGVDAENAHDNPPAQQKNRERLGVNEEHKTRKMREKHRGTFP